MVCAGDGAYLGSSANISDHNEKPHIRDGFYGLTGETAIPRDRQLNTRTEEVLPKLGPFPLRTRLLALAAVSLYRSLATLRACFLSKCCCCANVRRWV